MDWNKMAMAMQRRPFFAKGSEEEIEAGLKAAAGNDWSDMPVTAGFLADVFDAYCGADGHNLVVQKAMSTMKQKI